MNTLKTRIAPQERNVYSSLEIFDLEAGKATQLCEADHLIEAPNWTKDGKKIVYNAGGLLYAYDLENRRHDHIDTSYCTHCNNDHVLSPDGERVGISHQTVEDHASRLYVTSLRGGQPRLITPLAPSYLHGWSPDGKMLCYCAERNGQYDIYLIPSEGGEERQLTNEPGLDDGPEFSPDGKHIWFNSSRSGLMQIYRMDVNGRDVTQMTDEESNNWFPHVSPDGKWVVYISYRKGEVEPTQHPANKEVELRLMPSAGGKSRCLVPLFGGQGTLNVNSWAPDGKRFAFIRYREK